MFVALTVNLPDGNIVSQNKRGNASKESPMVIALRTQATARGDASIG
jgi:hypothetical protein